MKAVKCDLCDVIVDGETFEEWMEDLKSHYMQTHADVMKGKAGLTEQTKKEDVNKWMSKNRARFDAA